MRVLYRMELNTGYGWQSYCKEAYVNKLSNVQRKGEKSPKWTFSGNLRTGVSDLKLPSVSSERRNVIWKEH